MDETAIRSQKVAENLAAQGFDLQFLAVAQPIIRTVLSEDWRKSYFPRSSAVNLPARLQKRSWTRNCNLPRRLETHVY
jgi:hypothetical protein